MHSRTFQLKATSFLKFRQHFKADGAVCSLKQDAEGNFNFKIDGVSHVSWFRRKKDEFMEALGLPTRKQNRGIPVVNQKKSVIVECYITDFLYFRSRIEVTLSKTY